MKKLLSLALVLVLALTCMSFASAENDVMLGVILLHDEDSTYDRNFIEAVREAQVILGLSDDQIIIKRNIAESNDVCETCADLIDEGCNVIFADSFGHESFLLNSAKDYPEVQFCHATGTMAHTEGLDNFHDAFASIYEGRYIAGVAAGMKLNEIKAAGALKGEVPMMGYVGAFTYAEIISGYTAFYLGAKSVCPDVTMKVQFTGDWLNEMEEKNAAEALIAAGCDLISQHADSMGVPTACENAGIPNVAYNAPNLETCPNTFIVSSRIAWAPYFVYIVNCVKNGEAMEHDWSGNILTGSVCMSDVNENVAAAGTADVVNTLVEQFKNGEIKVFDTAKENFITINGEPLTSYIIEGTYEAVYDGYFHESEFRSAPYFDIQIDGIELLNSMY